MPHLFCFGWSYTAKALVRHLRDAAPNENWQISATVRTPEDQTSCAGDGINTHVFGSPGSKIALSGVTHILSSIPPGPAGDAVLASYSEALAGMKPLWLGYLSTTGPYGDCAGAWVDETAEPNPSGGRGQRRLDVENAWAALCETSALPLHIFRLPGLYGPGRSALDRVRDGTARRIVKPGQVFSRIHIDDLAMILKASMDRPRAGALYNVADDLPTPPQDVIQFVCEMLGVEAPPDITFEEANLSPMARSFYADNKRISNARIKSELGITLAWPTYREGLAAILAEETRLMGPDPK